MGQTDGRTYRDIDARQTDALCLLLDADSVVTGVGVIIGWMSTHKAMNKTVTKQHEATIARHQQADEIS